MKKLFKGFIKFTSCDNVIRILYRRIATAALYHQTQFQYNVQCGVDNSTITIHPAFNEYTESFDENHRWLMWMLPYLSDACDEPIIAIGFDKVAKEMETKEDAMKKTITLSFYDDDLLIDIGFDKKNAEGEDIVTTIVINPRREGG